MKTKFVIRRVIFALLVAAITAIVGLAVIIVRTPIGQPLDPTPLPPTILVPRGELPTKPVGLQEWVQYRGGSYGLAGSGFLILLSDKKIVGVTTAHSMSFGNPDRSVERIALRVAGRTDFVVEFDTLWGLPGRRMTIEDLSVDYVLLRPRQSIDPNLVLVPDPRGGPQPGERVSLFSGQSNGQEGLRVLEGTVQSANDTGTWVLMDDLFNPGLMSGSPFVSQHTGQVVGMAVAVTLRRNKLLLGAHPIGSIVRLAESATEFPKMSEYSR